jgi:hypothetical protein
MGSELTWNNFNPTALKAAMTGKYKEGDVVAVVWATSDSRGSLEQAVIRGNVTARTLNNNGVWCYTIDRTSALDTRDTTFNGIIDPKDFSSITTKLGWVREGARL